MVQNYKVNLDLFVISYDIIAESKEEAEQKARDLFSNEYFNDDLVHSIEVSEEATA